MQQTTVTRHLLSLEQTSQLAAHLGDALQGGEVLAMEGDLGAGKTSFTRELTRALGCSRLANSPTFALFQRYRGGRLPVLHGDLYRLGDPSELIDLGWEEMLDDFSEGVVVLEWADRFPELLPEDHLRMVWNLSPDSEQRILHLRAQGSKSCHLLQEIRKMEETS